MINLLMFAGGLLALVAGADLLVRGASRLAIGLGISPLVVGLTVVAFGTSAPEMAVSTGAVLAGNGDLAIGNAVGSNIFNVLFILGLAAVIRPLVVDNQVIRQEVPIMIGSALILMVICLDGRIDRSDSLLLVALLAAYTVFLIRQSRRADPADDRRANAGRDDRSGRRWIQLLLIVSGLGLLVAGSDALVTAAVAFARQLGVSDVVIGLTIVAAGTSMPEVATSIMAAIRGERDIAVGNVIGSNIFNLFGVVGIAGLAAAAGPGELLAVPESVRRFDIWVMLATAVACLPIFVSGREIARWEGAVFLLYYVAYTAYLILAAQRHQALSTYADVMIGFVIPLTIVTLVVTVVRRRP